MAVALASIAERARWNSVIRQRVRETDRWLVRRGGGIVCSMQALNSAGVGHSEFMGVSYISRQQYDSFEPDAVDAYLASRFDVLLEGFRCWIHRLSGGIADAVTHERTPLEYDAQVNFITDSIALKLYWRGSFVGADDSAIRVEMPADIPARTEGSTIETVTDGSPVGERATTCIDYGREAA